MILLYKNDMANFEEQVKRRIYRQNYETLCDITDPEEKKNAINTPYMLVTEDYRRIVQEFRLKQGGWGRGEQQTGGVGIVSSKIIVEPNYMAICCIFFFFFFK